MDKESEHKLETTKAKQQYTLEEPLNHMEDSLGSKGGREEEMDQKSEDNVLVEGLNKAENEVGNIGSTV